MYDVLIEEIAETDLQDIFLYIGDELQEPGAARNVFIAIREAIKSLEQFPNRNPLIQEEPYRTIGIRKLLVKNYIVFYRVDDEEKTVDVLRIQYNRRQWQSFL